MSGMTGYFFNEFILRSIVYISMILRNYLKYNGVDKLVFMSYKLVMLLKSV